MTFDVVIPTLGRDSLRRLLEALAAAGGPRPGQLLVVDDRRDRSRALPLGGVAGVTVLAGRGAGPAAARNLGWRRAAAEWVAFLDDDVVPGPTWLADLARDLEGLGAEVAASQGRVRVPLPPGRRPTDWERNVRGLETARWATADMAYGPTGRTRTWGCGWCGPGTGSWPGGEWSPIPSGRRGGWSASGSRRGTRTTSSWGRCTGAGGGRPPGFPEGGGAGIWWSPGWGWWGLGPCWWLGVGGRPPGTLVAGLGGLRGWPGPGGWREPSSWRLPGLLLGLVTWVRSGG
jgi:hypothetical protein